MPIVSNEIERRARLVSLVYEVLRDMEAPADETTNMEVFSALSRAFFDKATALANLGAAAPNLRRQTFERRSLSHQARQFLMFDTRA
jgi:hypothetical protein